MLLEEEDKERKDLSYVLCGSSHRLLVLSLIEGNEGDVMMVALHAAALETLYLSQAVTRVLQAGGIGGERHFAVES